MFVQSLLLGQDANEASALQTEKKNGGLTPQHVPSVRTLPWIFGRGGEGSPGCPIDTSIALPPPRANLPGVFFRHCNSIN